MCSRLRKYLDNQFVNIFTSGAKVYKNLLWHLEHFVCFICNQSDVHVTYAPDRGQGSGIWGYMLGLAKCERTKGTNPIKS